MAPAAIGAGVVGAGFFTSVGAAGVASVVTAVYVGAAVGAVVGAGTAIVTGGDPLKGALKGALVGGVGGGVGGAMGLAGNAATAGTEVAGAGVGGLEAGASGVAEAGVANPGLANLPTSGSASGGSGAGAGAGAGTGGGAATGGTATGKTGILSGVTGWIDKNPMSAAIVAQGIGGAAGGIAENRAADKELDALMERDRLNYANSEIADLTSISLKTTLPSVGTFTQAPQWQMPESGLLPQWKKGDSANA